jgi:hypothetical protein
MNRSLQLFPPSSLLCYTRWQSFPLFSFVFDLKQARAVSPSNDGLRDLLFLSL